jgi:hypothetical protein
MEGIRRRLDEERRKFTEAAVKLGRERAKLEVERIQFLDEKWSWQVELMFAELSPSACATYSSSIDSNRTLRFPSPIEENPYHRTHLFNLRRTPASPSSENPSGRP